MIRGLSLQGTANGNYVVDAVVPGTVEITLPAAIDTGDTITVAGVSSNRWTIRQNAGQSIETTSLGGNMAAGTNWTPLGAASEWWFAEASGDGNTLVALSDPTISGTNLVALSRDRGATWTNPASLPIGVGWTSAAISGNGDTIVLTGVNQPLFISGDGGAHWSAAEAALAWQRAAVSADGMRIAAADKYGSIHISTDAGVSWTVRSPLAFPAANAWDAVSMSSDGMTLLALTSGDYQPYVSMDGGVTWSALGFRGYLYGADVSADGRTMVIIDLAGVAQISTDAGLTWTDLYRPSGTATYTWPGVAVSADGKTIALAVQGVPIQLSTDGGESFTSVGPGGSFRSIALSDDGAVMLSADHAAGGRLYLSHGDRTAIGTLGSITAGQGDLIELEYAGNGVFNVRHSVGTFTIQ